ncbi:MAG: hypothetical protein H7039_05290, partial [Bryobacteraceae bacterium]|nr:hypothetical protein [Bryobacteraceae bacterium]
MTFGESTLYAMIVACEAAFWVVLFSGLAFRYVLGWSRFSRYCLLCVPLIDFALLALTVVDLRSGARAIMAHGLAVAYIGFTVAFGPVLIDWADQKFAQRFRGAQPASLCPRQGWASVRYELKLWARCLLAVAVMYVLLF